MANSRDFQGSLNVTGSRLGESETGAAGVGSVGDEECVHCDQLSPGAGTFPLIHQWSESRQSHQTNLHSNLKGV